MNTEFEDTVSGWMKGMKSDLISQLKDGSGPRAKLEYCDDDSLRHFLANIIIPAEEYEIAAVILNILEERGGLPTTD